MSHPIRNIPIIITILATDEIKQRIYVSFYGDVAELSFLNYQKIQFIDNSNNLYVGTYKTDGSNHYIENVSSSLASFTFENLTVGDEFTTYDYSYFWLPNQEDFLTLKKTYDFFKDKTKPVTVSLDNGDVNVITDENTMSGFMTSLDKTKLDSNKFYVGDSGLNMSSITVNINVGDFREFDLIFYGSSASCCLHCCFSDSNDLSVVFLQNNFSSLRIEAKKIFNEYNTYVSLNLVFLETQKITDFVVGINDLNNLTFPGVAGMNQEIITFNNGLQQVDISPKIFRIDKNRILSFEDSSSGAILIQTGTDLKNILKCGEYYCTDISGVTNKPLVVNVGFTMLAFSDGSSERPTRYELIDDSNKFFTGIYKNGTIYWKQVLNSLPEHTHSANEIETSNEKQFVSGSDKERWNNMAAGSSVWAIQTDTVQPDQSTWIIEQELLKKNYLQVSSDLTVNIKPNNTGIQGLVVVRNNSENEINITVSFDSITSLMLGIDTNLTADETTITVPNNKSIEIYYMKLDSNNLLSKIRLLTNINIASKGYKVVGEEGDLVI